MEQQEHPAHRAARLIRDMHVKTIEMIDAGTVFTRSMPDGHIENVSMQMRDLCEEQVKACEGIMAQSKIMGPEYTERAEKLLVEVTSALQPAVEHEKDDADEETELPEIGGWVHSNERD